LKEAVVLLISIVMVLSAISVTADFDEKMKIKTSAEDIAPLNRDILFEDDFESYEDFVIDFPPWINIDVDQSPTFSHSAHTWPNDTEPKAFIIFNPSATTPPMTDDNALPHGGDKYAACFNANNVGYISDDWLVTPMLGPANFDEVIFWAKSFNDQYNLERFEIGISTTDTDPSSFTIISEPPYVVPPYESWTEYTFGLDDYDGQAIYIGIHMISVDSWFFMVDDFSVTATTIEVDAGGPYEAYEGEDIQFEGTVSGGAPPYTFSWDFGNGDTSSEEDPVYAYDTPGLYEVTLTVSDSGEAEASDETTANIIEKPCAFEVVIPAGFGLGLRADVTETFGEDQTSVPWSFDVTGGLFFVPISDTAGRADFATGETKTIKAALVLGLGNVQISFTISDKCEPTTVDALILGPFVIVK
jgi:PKD repeat protein